MSKSLKCEIEVRQQGSEKKLKPTTVTAGQYGRYLFGRAIYPPGGRYGPRRQQAYQLVILTRGSLRLVVNERSYELKPEEAILLRPGGIETYFFSTAGTSEHLWCEAVAARFSPEQIQLLRSSSGVHAVNPFIHLLIEQGLRNTRANEGPIHCAFASLAVACLLYDTLEGSLPARTRSLAQHPVLRDAMEIASAEFSSLSSASQLARRLGISVSHLRLLFRQNLKESPSTYLWRLKTERAIQLLRSTGLSLKEVADQCGFADAFHLSRRVKAVMGESPRRLRQREWNQGVL